MNKNKLNLRNVIAIAICLAVTTVFSSCEKKTDYNKLEGTTWETEVDNVIFTLRFLNSSECTIGTARHDNSFSANLIPYRWRYANEFESRWGRFHLYHTDEEGEYAFAGITENKKLLLKDVRSDHEDLWFTRKK
jgi:hypothetical protein